MEFNKSIVESNFVFNYEKVDNIVAKFFSNENYPELLKMFDEPNIIQLPPGLPDEIPVIVAKSKGKHSDLNISPIITSLSTKYDSGYEKDINLCIKDFKDKFEPLFKNIQNVLNKADCHFLFGGLTFIVELSALDSKCDPSLIIFDKLTNFKIDANLDLENNLADFNFKIALSQEDYYINVTIGRSQRNSKKILTAIVDVNNKYAFSKDSNYCINADNLKKLFDITVSTVNSLDSILDGRLCING